MSLSRSILLSSVLVAMVTAVGCQEKTPAYGVEASQALSSEKGEVWAIAPVINLSGQNGVDPLLQADIAFQQLQHVRGLTIIPVNRVAEVYASLRIEKIQSAEQAAIVCDLLGCSALIVPTVTTFDPYNPPKFGASLQMFRKPGKYDRPNQIDPRALSRAAAPMVNESLPPEPEFLQAVGMYDAANGSIREALLAYATGRNDPIGPMGAKEYLVSMDRYCGFVYHELIGKLLDAISEEREKDNDA